MTMQGSVLADVAVKAIKKGPKWKPAIKYGKPVIAIREQSVFFRPQE
jgi:hypothetical protein